jgi:hypothetical protein
MVPTVAAKIPVAGVLPIVAFAFSATAPIGRPSFLPLPFFSSSSRFLN